MSALEEILRHEIAVHGAMPFARFMDLALYHPEHGYYEREPTRVGKRGDYFTSVSVGNLFGELLAFQFAEWLQEKFAVLSAAPEGIQIVEAGAHDGRLAADVLTWLAAQRPALFATLEYWIVEPSSRRRAWQQATLRDFGGKIQWLADLPEPSADPAVRGVRGIIFSNELLDAMPMHRFGWDAGEGRWFEWGVEVREERFVWTRLALAPSAGTSTLAPTVLDLPLALLAVLPDGFTVESCPRAVEWWDAAAQALSQGKLVTFDYGLTAEERIRPERCDGTLRAYRGHRTGADVLTTPGEQDLTAHVNFTALQGAGEAAGLSTDGLVSQGQFLVHILRRVQEAHFNPSEWPAERMRQFHTLIHPEHLGRAFRVLVQGR